MELSGAVMNAGRGTNVCRNIQTCDIISQGVRRYISKLRVRVFEDICFSKRE